ncbi:MAG: hypothetical protein C0506_11510 [Anaerolinea sp.]|nr:hypothetical protein [Anaerolinea sp.]
MTSGNTTAAPAGRLERRKARTRAAIVQAATSLFRANGYEATSVQQIAEQADTGVGTLYGYFTSKEEILREVLRSRSEEAFARYFAQVDESSTYVDRICTAMRIVAAYINENRRILVAAFGAPGRDRGLDNQSQETLKAAFSALLTTGMERGEIAPLPAETTAQALIGMVTMAVLGVGIWAGREDDPLLLAELEHVTRRLLSGMS